MRSLVLVEKDRQRLLRYRAQLERETGKKLGLPKFVLELSAVCSRKRWNIYGWTGAPFSWETLQRGLAGRPIKEEYHRWIQEFLDHVLPSIASKNATAAPELVAVEDFLRTGRNAQAAVDQAIAQATARGAKLVHHENKTRAARVVRGSR
jgi:hypothetical protein